MEHQTRIFDTRVDTKKFIVPIKTKFVPRNYANKQGLSLVYLHVTENYQRERIPLDIYVDKKKFSRKTQRLASGEASNNDLNLILDNVDSKITAIKTTFRLSNKTLDIDTFVEEFINGIPRIDFIAFGLRHLEDEKGKLAEGTYKRYRSVFNKLKEFKKQIFFTQINYQFIVKLRSWLSKRGNESTTIEGNIAAIKKFLSAAKKYGIHFDFNPEDIKIGNTNGDRVDLVPSEVIKLIQYFQSSFINDTNRLVLGYFLFSCFNGFRISEIQTLKRNQFEEEFFVFYEQKGDRMLRRNINSSTRKILETAEMLFVEKFTDQYLNRELKKIVKLCGITKKVSFHTGRHTFATNFLRMGGDVISLKGLLGHSKLDTTMIYVHIVEAEVNEKVYIIDKLFN